MKYNYSKMANLPRIDCLVMNQIHLQNTCNIHSPS